MPPLVFTKCNKCGFFIHGPFAGIMYHLDEQGNRVLMPHPSDNWAEFSDDQKKEPSQRRMGYQYHSVCLDCLEQFMLDLEQDKRLCPSCAEGRVMTKNELAGKTCPKCEEGTIEQEESEIWS